MTALLVVLNCVNRGDHRGNADFDDIVGLSKGILWNTEGYKSYNGKEYYGAVAYCISKISANCFHCIILAPL